MIKANEMLLTAGAYLKILKLKPGLSWSEIISLFENDNAESTELIFDVAMIMSKEYEKAKKEDDPEYEMKPLTKNEIASYSLPEAIMLCGEVAKALEAGWKQEIEVEPLKKTEEKK